MFANIEERLEILLYHNRDGHGRPSSSIICANIEERLEVLFDHARHGHGRTFSSMMYANIKERLEFLSIMPETDLVEH